MSGGECGAVVLWAAGLCAVSAAGGLLAPAPRDREHGGVGRTSGIALGAFAAAAWYVSAACRTW